MGKKEPILQTIQQGQPEFITPSGPQRGAFWDGRGINFSIASKNAERVDLCLFDETGQKEVRRITLPGHTGNVWHGYVPDLKPGQVYGYRLHGPFDPARGLYFNPDKLQFDPSARETAGAFMYSDLHNGAAPGDPGRPDPRDNAAAMIKARVAKPWPEAGADVKPAFPPQDNINYEANVRGLTMQFPGLPPAATPGTGAALVSDPVMARIQRHGNTVELQPVNIGLTEPWLHKAGLNNLWNYNALGWFAPDPRLFPGGAADIRDKVKKMHDAGLKVVLDLAFNHTAETGDHNPVLRGVDNSTYYRLNPKDKSRYEDWTGCGNTINIDEPETQRLILDSLRYWITEIGADGIRFDLATILGRDRNGDFSPEHPFMKMLMSDPIISKAQLIFEPWDARLTLPWIPPAQQGRQTGNGPPGACEWNDQYRDDVRDFWRGDESMTGKLASCLSGSAEIFEHKSTSPHVSINAVTFHDGFVLRDLVSYNDKHNEANAEDNRDGNNTNHSRNYGVEGPTDDAGINALRLQQMRNLLATLFLSQGTPQVLQGDEVGNSQGGNNNGYPQDNPDGWVTWLNGLEGEQFEDFSAYLKTVRDEFSILRHHEYMHGNKIDAYGVPDIAWIAPDGRTQQDQDWSTPWARCFGMLLNGGAVNLRADQTRDNRRLFAVFNAAANPVAFQLPALPGGTAGWTRILDTDAPEVRRDSDQTPYNSEKTYIIPQRSVTLFVQNPVPAPMNG